MFTKQTSKEVYDLLVEAQERAAAAKVGLEASTKNAEAAISDLDFILKVVSDNFPEIADKLELPTEFEVVDQKILDVIRRHGAADDGITRRDIMKAMRSRTPKHPSAMIEFRLKALTEGGKIELIIIPQPEGKPGRPMRRYILR